MRPEAAGSPVPADDRTVSPAELLRRLGAARAAAIAYAVFAAGMASLLVHDVALVHLHIPYPRTAPIPAALGVVRLLLAVAGTAWFAWLARRPLAAMPAAAAAAAVAVLVAMLGEFLRVVVITTTLAKDGWTHGYYVFAVARLGPRIAVDALVAAALVLVVRRTERRAAVAAAVLLATVAEAFALSPGADAVSSWLTHRLAVLDADNRFEPPYPVGVYAVIYVTYAEATFAMAGLAWSGLRGGTFRRAATFCLVLLLMQGRVGQFAIGSFFVQAAPEALRFAATGQFLLETIVLGSACPLLWGVALRAGRRR